MKYPMAFVVMLLGLIFVVGSCNNNDSGSDYREVNEGVVNYKAFCVSSMTTDLETSSRGTLYVHKEEGGRVLAKVVSWVEVDPEDWGGVIFYIPWGWQVKSIASSYPTGSMKDGPSQYIALWDTHDNLSEWSQRVEIGTSHTYVPHSGSGGHGSVIIELLSKGKPPGDVLKVLVSVGSEIRNETRILGTDEEVIEVPLVPDEP